MPDFSSEEGVVLAYPEGHVDDVESEEALSKCSRVVFIDATWSQAKIIARDPQLTRLPRVKIRSKKTAFWRPQRGKAQDHLATIEVSRIRYNYKIFERITI